MLTVKLAAVPSVTAEPAVMVTVGAAGSSSSSIEKLAVPLALTPPCKAELPATLPRARVMVSSLSWVESPVAESVSVAVAEMPSPPVKVMVGGLDDRLLLARFA